MFADPQNQHNGGTVAFSPVDGYLYWGLGDGGGNSSGNAEFVTSITSTTDGHTNSTGPTIPHGNSQDRTVPFGKMLRINPLPEAVSNDPNAVASSNGQYQIPIDNPLTMQSNINPQTSLPYVDWKDEWRTRFTRMACEILIASASIKGVVPQTPTAGTCM